MRRGYDETMRFAEAMLATLNHPKNAAKGPWDGMTLLELREKLREERREVDQELVKIPTDDEDWSRLADELVDEANVCMMLREYAMRQI